MIWTLDYESDLFHSSRKPVLWGTLMITEILHSREPLTQDDERILYGRWNGLSPPRTVTGMVAGDRADAAYMLARSLQREDDLNKELQRIIRTAGRKILTK